VRLSRRVVAATGVAVAVVLAAGTALAVSRQEPDVRTEVLKLAGVPEPAAGGADPVTIDATLYLPVGGGPAPAVLLAHGFGGSKADLDEDARLLAQDGYVALAYSARGFGASGGLVHVDAPDFEVADAGKLLDVLAARPEVLKDSAGDPRVGVVGGSYGGALALLLAGHDHRVDAIAPQITWNDLRQALFPQFAAAPAAAGAAPSTPAAVATDPSAAGSGVFKKAWSGLFFGAGGSGSSRATPAPSASSGSAPAVPEPSRIVPGGSIACGGRIAKDICDAYLRAATTGESTAEGLRLLEASSPATVLGRITAPTLLVQGEADSLFPLSEGDANARGIAANGTPVKVLWYGGGHDGGLDETDRLREVVRDWFARYLKKDGSRADTRFEVTVPAATISSADSNPAPQVRVRDAEPGVAGSPPVQRRGIALQDVAARPSGSGGQLVVAPAGGVPAAVTSLPGLGSALGALSAAAGAIGGGAGTSGTAATGAGSSLGLSALPDQVAVFESAAVAGTVRIVGSPEVTLHVVVADGRDATLFAQLYDVAPGGSATLPEQLVSPVRLRGVPFAGVDVRVSLPAVVRDVGAGHRLRLVVSTTDQAYALPAGARYYRVSLSGSGAVDVPVVPMTVLGGEGLATLLPWALALLVACVLVMGALALYARRHRGGPGEPALAGVPLAVEGLGKRYADGFRAVSDVSFRVEHGWVLGLLGPNGAGKTTTLRMLMGLIAPTEGRIRIFGHQVRPGAPVLSRVGAFVEGPGFLPHVSGLENLRLFWGATGRPLDDAHLDDALEIAGLGDDVHRKVRTYSHGMRQRLAIAQAMLGLPDLLVLDEPTNGLDPPQIREMREVLGRYAGTGRTVVVSSHLLSEVEQTCDHVVVMHQGRLVAQGEVADLVGSATALVVDVDQPQRAAEVASSLDGAREVAVTPTGITLKLVGTPRSELVRVLVADGLAVDRIAPQRGLEEAFLALVGEA
jgi:ABC-2 type transport system ATP-binding protein